jgi:hypothetical protein
VALPTGLTPGEPADRLREIARIRPDAQQVVWSGWREAVRAELDAVDSSRLGPWMPWSGTPRARALALTQAAAGLPLTTWGLRRRSGGWTVAGALLLSHGLLGLAYDLARPRD